MQSNQLIPLTRDHALILNDYAMNVLTLFNYSNTPVESDNDVIERAEVMDMLMDMAKSETDIAMVYAHAISDRIEEYEKDSLEVRGRLLMENK